MGTLNRPGVNGKPNEAHNTRSGLHYTYNKQVFGLTQVNLHNKSYLIWKNQKCLCNVIHCGSSQCGPLCTKEGVTLNACLTINSVQAHYFISLNLKQDWWGNWKLYVKLTMQVHIKNQTHQLN